MKKLIFDYDGTLHESIKLYAPAFRLAQEYLVSIGYAESKSYTEKEISVWLGMSAKEMWNQFMPHLPEQIKSHCSNLIGNEMLRLIKEGRARLYPNTIATLEYLKQKGVELIFLSNCKRSYMEAHIETFGLDQYFTEFYCTEDYNFMPKYEIYKFIPIEKQDEIIIVGDRYQDMEIAIKNQLYAIGCSYGYGCEEELSAASVQIHDIGELRTLL